MELGSTPSSALDALLSAQGAGTPMPELRPLGSQTQRTNGQPGGQGDGKDDKDGKGIADSLELSPEAQKMVTELKARDAAVRAHEAAHVAAGGGVVAGGATFTYQQGPDGRRYAVGGEVPLDVSPVKNNPRATEMKARQIQAAALAPADPSPQDRKIAAQASQMAAQAAAQLASQAVKDIGGEKGEKGEKDGTDRIGATLDIEA